MVFRFRFMTVAVLAAVFMLMSPAIATAQKSIGQTQKVVRQVDGALNNNVRRLAMQDDVYSNEKITTAEDSATRLTFLDKTMLSIGANSNVVLDRFVFDPDPAKSTVAISMSKGVMRFVSGTLPKSNYTIRTPTASIGIRGTIIEVIVAANGATTVNVIEGTALVVANGGQQLVTAGQTTVVAIGAIPTAPSATAGAGEVQVAEMNRLLGPDPGEAAATALDGEGGLIDIPTGGLVAIGVGILAIAILDDDDSSSSTSTGTGTKSGSSGGSSY